MRDLPSNTVWSFFGDQVNSTIWVHVVKREPKPPYGRRLIFILFGLLLGAPQIVGELTADPAEKQENSDTEETDLTPIDIPIRVSEQTLQFSRRLSQKELRDAVSQTPVYALLLKEIGDFELSINDQHPTQPFPINPRRFV